MTKFQENLSAAFSESQYDLALKNQDSSPHYQRLKKRQDRLVKAIDKRMGGKHRKLTLRLEEVRNELTSIDGDLVYRQGMIDCVILLKTIKLI